MRFLFPALFALALAGCATPSTPASPPHAGAAIHLSGTKWIRTDDMDANPHGATMDFGDTRASGYTGCNRWFADVTQNSEELRFGPVGTTRMACQTEMQRDTERHLLDVLAATRYAHYDQQTLVLLDSEQHQLASFDSAL